MIPVNIPLVLRIPKGSPLTPGEVDSNFSMLRDAVTSLAQVVEASRIIIGDEPPAGERSGVLWVPLSLDGVYVWNSSTSSWVLMTPKEVVNVTDTGTGANYIISAPPGMSSYSDFDGRLIVMRASHNSTGPSKVKVKNDSNLFWDSSGVNLVNHYLGSVEADDIRAGQKILMVYNSGQFQMLSPTPPVRLSDLRNVYTYQSNLAAVPASGGVLSFAHGLKHNGNGITPGFVSVVLRRKNSDYEHAGGITIRQGDEIGAECLWDARRGSENEMFWPVVRTVRSDSEVKVQFYYPNGIAMLWNYLSKNTGTASQDRGSIDRVENGVTNYEVRVYAMAFNTDQLGSSSGGSQSGGSTQPVVTSHPSNTSALQGSSATFTAAGQYGVSASWWFDGSEISGSRFSDTDSVSGNNVVSTLVISNITASDNGKKVYAVIQGPGGVVATNEATITVTS